MGFFLSATLPTVCVQGAADAQLGGGGGALCVLRPETHPGHPERPAALPWEVVARLQQISEPHHSSSRQTLPPGGDLLLPAPRPPSTLSLDALVCHPFRSAFSLLVSASNLRTS